MTIFRKTFVKMILLGILATSAFFLNPPKAYATPYCAILVTYYSDATFSTPVGSEDTTNCQRAIWSGQTGTGYTITYNYGSCGNGCSTGPGDCACGGYSEAICIQGSCTYY